MKKYELAGGAQEPQKWIALIKRNKSLKIRHCDILFIEQKGCNLRVHKADKVIQTVGRVRQIAKDFEDPFFQCHSYLIINLERVCEMEDKRITFDNHEVKYVGQNSFARARRKFNQYLLR